mmetsp:Transcript_102420/g.328332  ORF Transcript_102420/g.328332 Transcript_102420/m.328332 type:complete len:200 (+) Transcript_102420:635-1234(+)
MENHGLSTEDARAQVMQEFPFVFHEGHGRDWWHASADCDGIPAEDRAKWFTENEGFSEHAARLRVKNEFPHLFHGGGDFLGCGKFPHTVSLVDTETGPRLELEVVCNVENVGLVAVHYQINDGTPMNFDTRHPEGGSRTYAHVTPPLAATRSAAMVTVWPTGSMRRSMLSSQRSPRVAPTQQPACSGPLTIDQGSQPLR